MTKTYRNIYNEHFYHLNQVSGYRLIKIPVGETVQTTDSYNPMRQSWEIGFSDILNPYAAANSYWRLAKEQIFEDVEQDMEQTGEDGNEKDDEKKQNSFFSGFDSWLGEKIGKWGNNFNQEGWRKCVSFAPQLFVGLYFHSYM